MDGILIGNVVGRLLLSYLLVWVFMWVLRSKFNFRRAFSNTHRWYGVIAIAIVFTAGLAANLTDKGIIL